MSSAKPSKVLVLADVPSPHQNAFFDAIAELGEVDLEVAFCRRTMPGRAWSGEGPRLVRHVFLPELSLGSTPINPTVIPYLAARRDRLPFVIGYYLPGLLAAITFLETSRRPWVFWTDTLDPLEGLRLRRMAVAAIRRWSLRGATICLSTGERGRDALLANGVPPERAYEIPFVVDREWIETSVDAQRTSRLATRATLSIPVDARLLLYVGQFIQRKGLDLLLEAFASMAPERRESLHLLLVGGGAEEAALREQAVGLGGHVHFLPNTDNSALPPYWAAADAFVLPARFDAWPVVTVEALTAGLPVLGSDACGSVVDRVIPGRTGWIFRTGERDELRSQLETISCLSAEDVAAMGTSARASMEPYSPLAMARRFTQVVLAAEAMKR